LENNNPMVLNTMNQLASSLCTNTLALDVYEEDAYIFGTWVNFPLYLPSTELWGTAVTQPGQVAQRDVEWDEVRVQVQLSSGGGMGVEGNFNSMICRV
jgi:hypothetical protein